MLAARAYFDQDDLVLEELDEPEPGPGDVIVRVAAAGLAPGVFNLLRRGLIPNLPVTPGHEIAGEVAQIGADVQAVAVGDRVRVHPNLTCRVCGYCTSDREQMCSACSMIGHGVFGPDAMPLYERYRNGGFAQFVKVPVWAVDPLPENVSFDVGAKVHDLANAMRALKLASLFPGSSLIVTAATGTMGTAVIRLAPLFGVTRIVAVGRSSERVDQLAKLAPGLVDTVSLESLDSSWAEEGGLTAALAERLPTGADAVIDFLPEGPGTGQALTALRTGGSLVHMGGNYSLMGVPMGQLMLRCWRVIGTRNCSRGDARAVLDLLGTGALTADDLLTHTFPLSDVNAAVTTMLGRTDPMWMATVRP